MLYASFTKFEVNAALFPISNRHQKSKFCRCFFFCFFFNLYIYTHTYITFGLKGVAVLLMGSRDEDVPAEPREKTVFVEDMTEADIATKVSIDNIFFKCQLYR